MTKLNDRLYVDHKLSNSVNDLLLQIITLFSNTNLDNFDEKLQSVFSMVGSHFEITWINLYQYRQNLQVLDNTHEWCSINSLSKNEMNDNEQHVCTQRSRSLTLKEIITEHMTQTYLL